MCQATVAPSEEESSPATMQAEAEPRQQREVSPGRIVDSSRLMPSEAACMAGVGWRARGDRQPEEKRVPFNRPTAKQVYDALPFVRRYFMYWMRHTGKKEKLFINTFQPLQHKPYYGVPCGGIGAGSIGRDFRGGFCKFGLRPGLIEHKIDVIPANQFIFSIRHTGAGGPSLYQKVLSAADICRSNGQLSAWNFDFPANDVTYRGLYPRAWTCYRIPELNTVIVIRQVSPVLPEDYEDSSLPACAFVVDIENQSETENYDVSVAFTFRNGTGRKKSDERAACQSKAFKDREVHGVELRHILAGMPCSYGVAAKASSSLAEDTSNVSVCRNFKPSGSGAELWRHLEEHGSLPDQAGEASSDELGVGVCVRTTVSAGECKKDACEFALSWDMPIVRFGDGGRSYKRRYTRFFGAEGKAASAICTRVLRRRQEWEKTIEEWQAPVLKHRYLPDWYKSALFNELYFMTDGGSVWFEWDDAWSTQEEHLSEYSAALMREHGRFGYLESWEYRMVNTYDVHFYASFALATLWPQLELALQAEFTDHIEHVNERQVKFHMEGDLAPQKSRRRVPHDMGNPADDPWLFTNAYVMHDTGKWKDLNLKFVLTSWRDYVALVNKNADFLRHVYPAVKCLVEEALRTWDRDGDGMIENFGKADQTYDAWKMEGVSAYCGSLWLASLRVTVEMAKDMGDDSTVELLMETFKRARQAFISKLWTGEYFRFCERSKSRDSVMADQLCGVWFLQSVSPDLAEELLPADSVRSALQKIFELNVECFGAGRMGAVNGMRPDGRVDRAYIQADEMWTGVTYAVAAFMIQQGDYQRAFDTAFGSYDACFNRFGLQYQTPEALYEKKFYRAIGYMRPLAIWAMQWALERHAHLGSPREPTAAFAALRLAPPPTPPTRILAPPTRPLIGANQHVLPPVVAACIVEDEDDASEGYGSDERKLDDGSSSGSNPERDPVRQGVR